MLMEAQSNQEGVLLVLELTKAQVLVLYLPMTEEALLTLATATVCGMLAMVLMI
jgi:hypothetical protein